MKYKLSECLRGHSKMTSPGEGRGGFAKGVTNSDKGGRGLLVGGDVTTEKKIDSYILLLTYNSYKKIP